MEPDTFDHGGAEYQLMFERRPLFWLGRVFLTGAQLFAVHHQSADDGQDHPVSTVRAYLRRAAIARMAWWHAAA